VSTGPTGVVSVCLPRFSDPPILFEVPTVFFLLVCAFPHSVKFRRRGQPYSSAVAMAAGRAADDRRPVCSARRGCGGRAQPARTRVAKLWGGSLVAQE
jgi:hypothetical protein